MSKDQGNSDLSVHDHFNIITYYSMLFWFAANLYEFVQLQTEHTETTHNRSKTVTSRTFCPHVCGLSHFKDLIRFFKSFSVYPALVAPNFEYLIISLVFSYRKSKFALPSPTRCPWVQLQVPWSFIFDFVCLFLFHWSCTGKGEEMTFITHSSTATQCWSLYSNAAHGWNNQHGIWQNTIVIVQSRFEKKMYIIFIFDLNILIFRYELFIFRWLQ